ncbi:MAG: DUF5666 domain-containing protein, partial [Anaerolineae bacterium]
MTEINEYKGIVERLKELRKSVYRDPEMAARTRERYLAQVEDMAPRSRQGMSFVARLVLYWKGQSEMFRKVASIALVIVLLLVGTGVTVQASQNSLPGDRLYSLKRFSENVRQKLAVSEAADTALAVSLAERRIQEATSLAERSDAGDRIDVEDLTQQLSRAIEKIEALEKTDPERARALAQQLDEALSQNKKVLGEIGQDVSPPEGEGVGDSLDDDRDDDDEVEFEGKITEVTSSGEWVVETEHGFITVTVTADTEVEGNPKVDDWVEVEGFWQDDGSVQATEIEVADDDDDWDDNDWDDDAEFEGRVGALPDEGFLGTWVVRGISVIVTADTEVEGSPKVGAWVEVEGFWQDDNTVQATEIEVEEPDDDDLDDDWDDDWDDDDDEVEFESKITEVTSSGGWVVETEQG